MAEISRRVFATPPAVRVFATHAGGIARGSCSRFPCYVAEIARRVFATPAAVRVFATHAGVWGFGGSTRSACSRI